MQSFDTARMHLRPVALEDLDALVELDSDPEVMRYISGGEPNPRAVYESDLLPRMRAYLDQPFGYFSAFSRADPGEFWGWFHLRPSVFEPEVLELGYRLRRDRWGQGLATEGSRALLAHGFEVLEVGVIDAGAMADNEASISVMRKCGMRYVGMFEHPRVPVELARYVVERADYLSEQARGSR